MTTNPDNPDTNGGNTAQALYAMLFQTLRDLRSKTQPMEIDRARTVCTVADSITALARAEIDMMRITGNKQPVASGFLLGIDGTTKPTSTGHKTTTPGANGIEAVTKHLMRG